MLRPVASEIDELGRDATKRRHSNEYRDTRHREQLVVATGALPSVAGELQHGVGATIERLLPDSGLPLLHDSKDMPATPAGSPSDETTPLSSKDVTDDSSDSSSSLQRDKSLSVIQTAEENTLWARLKKALNAPTYAVIVAIVVGLIPPLRDFIYASEGQSSDEVPLGFLSSAVTDIGAMVR